MADGSITIDTKVSSDGLKDLDKVGEAMGGSMAEVGAEAASTEASMGIMAEIGGILTGIVGGIATAFAAVVVVVVIIAGILFTIVSALVSIAAGVVKFGISLLETMRGAMNTTTAYAKQVRTITDGFEAVKQAIYGAFSPIVAFALPYIMQLVNWLIVVFNTIGMIIAALFKQKTVMQYIAGSTNSMAQSAQGALAAFDQINVLNNNNNAQNIGAGKFASVEVDPEILAKTWEGIKKWWRETVLPGLKEGWYDLWTGLHDNAVLIWNKLVAWIITVWTPIAAWFQVNVIDPVVLFFVNLWTSISTGATNAWNWLAGIWDKVVTWFMTTLITPAMNSFKMFWNFFSAIAYDAWLLISGVWGAFASWVYNTIIVPVVAKWLEGWNNIKTTALMIWEAIKLYWGTAGSWFQTNVIDKLMAVFADWYRLAKLGWSLMWDGIVSLGKGAVNLVINIINSMVSGVETGVNYIVKLLNGTFSGVHGWKIIPEITLGRIPTLAQGAVIPPNSAFAAILGDQTSGRNIEAPEDLIRQIIKEEVGNGAGREITIRFEGTLAALVRELKPVIDQENGRIGGSLIRGVA